MTPDQLLIDEFDYGLTDDRIAKYPLAQRDSSKLLVYGPQTDAQGLPLIEESVFAHIGNYLPNGALLVYNNTRVIQARIVFHKLTGARIEIFCLEPSAPNDYALNLGATDSCEWHCMVGNLKKWKEGELQLPIDDTTTLCATLLENDGKQQRVRFSWSGGLSFAEILNRVGELPIPPYLNRQTEQSDKVRYQTVYSKIEGSVAAPTAGLHFTQEVLTGLRANGIETDEVTLHVGAGTFLPVKTRDANQHEMHTEIIAVRRTTIEHLLRKLGRIVAVGTTSVRTLESLYFIGCQIANGQEPADGIFSVAQFEPYNTAATLSTAEALQAILSWMERQQTDVLHGKTQIMIKPSYTFHLIDTMITNFHQPKSTLLLLVSAFVDGDWKRIYDYALQHQFRFLSYGDSSLLFRPKNRSVLPN